MEGFEHILNWKLKAGSHRFPGPDGGTCINEAALVAAGFAYRPILHAWQMPSCFSRPICHFAMLLNDSASDKERQLLLPFVTRLACADSWQVEEERELYIQSHMPRGRLSMAQGIAILEGALAIGRQADSLAPELAHARLDAVRGGPEGGPQKGPLFGRIKSWLAAKLEAAG